MIEPWCCIKLIKVLSLYEKIDILNEEDYMCNRYTVLNINGIDHDRCLIKVENKDKKQFLVLESDDSKPDYIQSVVDENVVPHYTVNEILNGKLKLNIIDLKTKNFEADFKQSSDGFFNGTYCKCIVKEIISDLEFIVDIPAINETNVALKYCMSEQKYEKYYKLNKPNIKMLDEIYVNGDLWFETKN